MGGEPGRPGVDAVDPQARVGLVRGAEVGVDAEVDPDGAGLEPAAAAGREGGRLGDLGQAGDAEPGGAAGCTWSSATSIVTLP